MQSIKLEETDFKKFNALMYKYIWNRQYLVPKAPERVKRTIVNTPINKGGFGMLDAADLDKSLKLRALGRVFDSNHPFIKIVKNKLNLENFFEPAIGTVVETISHKAIELLREERAKIWNNPKLDSDREVISVIRSMNLRSLLNRNGLQSLVFFRIWNNGARKVKDLSVQALNSLKRFIDPPKHNKLDLAIRLNLNQELDSVYKSIIINGRVKNLSKCTSKEIRENCYIKAPIQDLKLGLALDLQESNTWYHRISKLTSTKHKNTLLRLIHGEFYTKEKLHRFGLVDSNLCPRCDQIETLRHKFFECEYIRRIWEVLERKTACLLTSPIPVMDVTKRRLGIFGDSNLCYITLVAEVLLRISYLDEKQEYLIRPQNLIEHCLKSVVAREKKTDIKDGIYSILNAD